MNSIKTDFLVIGAGIIGLTLALRIKNKHPDCSLTLIEKEKDCGIHASGRNSGILHAGFYYTADSLKARFTRQGNKLLKEYCRKRKLLINPCGKLVVAKNHSELPVLDELLLRAKLNGVELHEITADEAEKIEPRVKTFERALFSPATSSVNPKEVVASLVTDARKSGIVILADTAYLKHDNNDIVTTKGNISAGYIINAAGLYADKIARDFGFSKNFFILPFKGLFLMADNGAGKIHTNIYPVPDLKNPFLGVHFTITAEGSVQIGPTAIPAFWREQYSGMDRFKLQECIEILYREFSLLLHSDFDFHKLAINELIKYFRPIMVRQAAQLISGIDGRNYRRWGASGIRAQLVNIKRRRLEMDFLWEGDSKSFHVLNAVSPGFTCSIAFARYLLEQIEKKMMNDG